MALRASVTGGRRPKVGHVASLHRYPVKGFTPERVSSAELVAGGYFPGDRLFAVENGPSGFDPAAAAFVPKTRFTVLAQIPKLALARTSYDERSGVLSVKSQRNAPFAGDLRSEQGKEAFAAWLAEFLDPADQRGELKVLTAPPHRFTDNPRGFISVVNLESVRDLASRLGRPIDPLRFRANVYVEGWPAWSELDLAPEAPVRLGSAATTLVKSIRRCVATHVNPETGERDIEIVTALRDSYGHQYCGVYLNVAAGACLDEGDPAELWN
jgi:MOSC domain-containing protein